MTSATLQPIVEKPSLNPPWPMCCRVSRGWAIRHIMFASTLQCLVCRSWRTGDSVWFSSWRHNRDVSGGLRSYPCWRCVVIVHWKGNHDGWSARHCPLLSDLSRLEEPSMSIPSQVATIPTFPTSASILLPSFISSVVIKPPGKI